MLDSAVLWAELAIQAHMVYTSQRVHSAWEIFRERARKPPGHPGGNSNLALGKNSPNGSSATALCYVQETSDWEAL